MNSLQQEAQQLRTKEMHINDLLQPYQEQIAEIVDTVEQKNEGVHYHQRGN